VLAPADGLAIFRAPAAVTRDDREGEGAAGGEGPGGEVHVEGARSPAARDASAQEAVARGTQEDAVQGPGIHEGFAEAVEGAVGPDPADLGAGRVEVHEGRGGDGGGREAQVEGDQAAVPPQAVGDVANVGTEGGKFLAR